MNNLTERELLIYLAGYFDGEGCVSVQKATKKYPYLQVQVASGDKEIIEKYFEVFGGHLYKEKGGTNRQLYRWTIGGAKAQEVLKILLPFLFAKKAQAELALIPNFRPGRQGIRLTAEERQLRLSVMAQIHKINTRVTIQ